ncbi:MAG: Rne/Rng family ribonuclease [SAR86 cluster bacterium]|nr:Rne/Rng family ribonuclease [SAR86 cluster bacterium]
MKRMLINASQPEELRLALVDGQSLYDFDLEQIGYERKRANIYKARVSRIEQSLGAAFIDYGAERHGFLPMKDIAPQYFPKGKFSRNSSIKDCLKEGQEIIVQVEKEERGNKGAALTTFITLAGHYIVLLPNNPEAGGISRNLDPKERDKIKASIRALEVPDKMGLIVRTAAKGVEKNELEWDLEYLLNVWDAIIEANQLRKAPFLVYRESDLITRSLRDYLRDDIKEVLIDSEEAHEKALDFVCKLMPEYESRIIHYTETTPLFSKYQIEPQIDSAQQREVTLESGGSICIDQTEALVAIDINSAKSTKGSNIEDTAVKTNLEAAKEIAKQLRLRDIGGLIVIDFIDMTSLKHKRQVEEAVWESVEMDRAKIQIGRISRFGLIEMSRQRLRPSLQERWQQDINSLSTAVLRRIEEESAKENSLEIRAKVSPEMSVYLLNERRSRINEIEQKASIRIVIKADQTREDDRYEVTRIRINDAKNNKVPQEDKEDKNVKQPEKKKNIKPKKLEVAAVDIVQKARPVKKDKGFFGRLIDNLFKKKAITPPSPKPRKASNQNKNRRTNYKTSNQNKNRQASANKKEDSKKLNPEKAKNRPNNPKNTKDKQSANKSTTPRKPVKQKTKEVDGNKIEPENNSIKNVNSKASTSSKTSKKPKDWGQASNDPRFKEIPASGNTEEILKEVDGNKIEPENNSIKNVNSKGSTSSKTSKKPKDFGKADNDPRSTEMPSSVNTGVLSQQEILTKNDDITENKSEEKTKIKNTEEESNKLDSINDTESSKRASDWGMASNDPRNQS